MIRGPGLASLVATAPLASTAAKTGPFLVERLCALDAQLASAAERVLATDDGSAVHDLRVALRRTRTVLEVGRPVLGPFLADAVKRCLRDVHKATGALRDEEVLLDLLSAVDVEASEVGGWIASRHRRERALRSQLRSLLRQGALERGRRMLGALLLFPIKPSRERRLLKFARRAMQESRREVDRRRLSPIEDTVGMHRLRIAYKRLRYNAETLAPALPPEIASIGQTAARLQARLGELNDVDVALACVRRARSLKPPAREALIASLVRLRAERARACEGELGTRGGVYWMGYAAGGDPARKTSTR
jgi:CHAD domain-containing protein